MSLLRRGTYYKSNFRDSHHNLLYHTEIIIEGDANKYFDHDVTCKEFAIVWDEAEAASIRMVIGRPLDPGESLVVKH